MENAFAPGGGGRENEEVEVFIAGRCCCCWFMERVDMEGVVEEAQGLGFEGSAAAAAADQLMDEGEGWKEVGCGVEL